jgi:hypothetical protein
MRAFKSADRCFYLVDKVLERSPLGEMQWWPGRPGSSSFFSDPSAKRPVIELIPHDLPVVRRCRGLKAGPGGTWELCTVPACPSTRLRSWSGPKCSYHIVHYAPTSHSLCHCLSPVDTWHVDFRFPETYSLLFTASLTMKVVCLTWEAQSLKVAWVFVVPPEVPHWNVQTYVVGGEKHLLIWGVSLCRGATRTPV